MFWQLQLKKPKQGKGESYDGKPSDLWSLGGVLHVMLSCTLPFGDKGVCDQGKVVNSLIFFAFPFSGRSTPVPMGEDKTCKTFAICTSQTCKTFATLATIAQGGYRRSLVVTQWQAFAHVYTQHTRDCTTEAAYTH